MCIKVVIIKPVDNGCNLNCKYCYVDGNINKISFMDINIAKRIIEEMFLQKCKKITFLWHGGEPMLRGLDFYKEIVEYQKEKSLDCDKEYRNCIQTNLTLLDQNWAKFIRENNIFISTSIDGSKEMHDKNRVFFDGTGSYNELIEKIKLAQSYDININALCVVSKENKNKAKEICKNLNDLNIKHVGFLPCFKINNGIIEYPSLEPNDYGNFMVDMFELLLNGIAKFEIREFEQILKACLGKKTNTCSFSGECRKFICVNSKGIIYSCDTEIDNENNKIGCILNESINSNIFIERHKKYLKNKKVLSTLCEKCEYVKYCNNGCPNKMLNSKYYFCNDRKIMFKYVENILHDIIYNNIER